MKNELTDEELVKAYELCITDSIRCNECPYSEPLRDGFGYCNGDMEEDVLDLIHRLQSEKKELEDLCNKTYDDLTKEIERLTEEKDKYQEKWQTSYTNELNLQKQVDELNKAITSLKYAHLQDECKLADLISTCKRAIELSDEWKAKFKQAVKDTAKEIGIVVIQLSNMCPSVYEFQNRLVDLIETNYGVEIVRETIIPTKGVEVE